MKTPLSDQKEDELVKSIPDWIISRDGPHILKKKFKFKDFKEAIEFVNKVADVAEGENHHPDIKISYNKVVLKVTSHDIGGLSKRDFNFAEKVDKVETISKP